MSSETPDMMHEEREWFRVTLGSIGDAVIATDLQGSVIFMNPVAEGMTGWTLAEATGKPLDTVFRIINEFTRKPSPNPVARVLREGVVVGLANHTALISRAGVEAPIEDSAAPIRDAAGKIMGVVLVFHDITQRRKAELALQEVERRFRLLVEGVKDYAIFMLDTQGNVVSWNAGAERIKGYRADEIIGSHFSRFYPPEDIQAQKPENELKIAVRDGRIEDQGWRLRKDGTRFWAEVTITAIRDEHGKLVGFAKVSRDVTERRAFEDRVRQSELRLRLLIDNVKDYALYLVDLNGNVASWNTGAERMKGYTAAEIIGKPLSTFYTPEDARANKTKYELDIATREGRFEEEGMRVRKNGQRFWANVVITAIQDISGKTTGFAKITRDITERKLAEQALQDSKSELERKVVERTAELEKAGRLKDEFLAMLSHELRTPLMPMLGWTRMLLGEGLDDEARSRGLHIIEKNIKLQTRIIEDLLDISGIIAGKLKLETKPILLSQPIEAAVDVIRSSAQAKSLQLEIAAHDVGPVMADPARMQQVVWNLLSNAVKFTPAGGKIHIELKQVDGKAVFSIKDTGEGIAPDYLPFVFDRFSQSDSSMRRRHGGLGLGLSIVKQIVETHGGTVAASSAGVGHGSTFTVTLPLAREGSVLAPDSAGPRTINSEGELAGLRLLIVDDEEDAREFLEIALQQYGAQVRTVGSASAALNEMDAFNPDVLISDLGMPERGGYDLIRELRQKGRDVPAIALTAFAGSEDRVRALSEGFQAHLPKPIDPSELVAVISNLVAKS